MKLITLRIAEEEKARLELLAERGDVTLSRALREGAALYLRDLQGRVHRVRGGDTTFLGLRRGTDGVPLSQPTEASEAELQLIGTLRERLLDAGLGSLIDSHAAGAPPRVVVAALGQWLSLLGEIYVGHPADVGWTWFLRDYWSDRSETDVAQLVEAIPRAAAGVDPVVQVEDVLHSLADAFERFTSDVEQQELVRRSVLPAWQVVAGRLA
jgi:hypothetical protein